MGGGLPGLFPVQVPLTVLVTQKFDNFPDFFRHELVPKRSHYRTPASLGDGIENHRIGRFVNPFVIGQIRPDRAFGFMAVAGVATGFEENSLSFCRGCRVPCKWIPQFVLCLRRIHQQQRRTQRRGVTPQFGITKHLILPGIKKEAANMSPLPGS
ncbi:MAG: hypothetical protein ABI648_00975 [Betaproteobacteria bacterium]